MPDTPSTATPANPQPFYSARRLNLMVAALVILACGALLLAAANYKYFWEDEVFTATYAQTPEATQGQYVAGQLHPPMYLFIANHWGQIFGFDELGLRSFSIIFVLVMLALTYRLASDTLGNVAALIAVTLLAFCPLVIQYGYNARYYSLAATLALCVALTTLWYQRSGHWLFLIGYILSAATFFYLLFSAASVLLAANLWAVLYWWYRRRNRSLQPNPVRRWTVSWAHLAIWLLAQAAVLIMVIPSIQLMFAVNAQTGGLDLGEWTAGRLLIEAVKRLGYFGFIFSVGETLSPLNPLAWLGVLVAGGLLLFALISWRKAIDFWLHVFMVTAIFVPNFLVTFQGFTSMTWQNLPHRIFFILPFLAIWLGAALVRLRPRLALATGILILVVFAAGTFNYFTGRQYIRPALLVPWAEVFGRIREQSGPEATIICSEGDIACGYYAKRFGFDGFSPGQWAELASQPPSEIWWLQTNVGRDDSFKSAEARVFAQIQQAYPARQSTDYAPQDPGIRWLKQAALHQEDYQYRLVAFHFFSP